MQTTTGEIYGEDTFAIKEVCANAHLINKVVQIKLWKNKTLQKHCIFDVCEMHISKVMLIVHDSLAFDSDETVFNHTQ